MLTVQHFQRVIQEYFGDRKADIRSAPDTYGLESPTETQIEQMARDCLIQDLFDHPEDFVSDLNRDVWPELRSKLGSMLSGLGKDPGAVLEYLEAAEDGDEPSAYENITPEELARDFELFLKVTEGKE